MPLRCRSPTRRRSSAERRSAAARLERDAALAAVGARRHRGDRLRRGHSAERASRAALPSGRGVPLPDRGHARSTSRKARPTCRSRPATAYTIPPRAIHAPQGRARRRARDRVPRPRRTASPSGSKRRCEARMNLAADIALAHRLADAARDAIRPHFREPVAAERKGDATPVTDRRPRGRSRRCAASSTPRCRSDGVHGEEFGVDARAARAGNGCSIRSTAPAPSSPGGRSSAR